jgi:hypothetical protein
VISAYYFVIHLHLGLWGVTLAGCLSIGSALILINVYHFSCEELAETVVKFDSTVFDREGLMQFVNLAIPSLIVASLNWWIWEVYILVAGLISVTD